MLFKKKRKEAEAQENTVPDSTADGNGSLMQSISAWIVKFRLLIVGIFAALLVFSVFSMDWVYIEEETIKFLPYGTQGRDALDIDLAEFESFGDVYVLVEHLTQEEADALAEKIDSIKNVAYTTVNSHPDDEGDGVTVSIYAAFMSEFDSEDSLATLGRISRMARAYDDSYVYSELLDDMTDLVNEQMVKVIAFVTIAVLLVLLLTSRSYAEIPLLLIVFTVAALINMGTNFIFGSISLISNAVAVVLQLALSMDYAIILINRYREAKETLTVRDAVVRALTGAVPEILASSLTTVAGLFAMTLMNLTIGADMGYVLIKAILISLLTVFFFMPALLLLFGKAIDKTKHRQLLPPITKLGRFSFATRHVVPVLFIILLAAACFGSSKLYITSDATFAPAKNMSDNDVAYYRMLDEDDMNLVEILVPAGDYDREAKIIEELNSTENVYSVTGLAGLEVLDGMQLTQLIGYEDIMNLAEVDDVSAKAVMAVYAASSGDHDAVMNDVSSYKAPLMDVFECLYDNLDNESLELEADQIKMIRELKEQLDRLCRELQGANYSRIVFYLNLPMEGEETAALIDELHAMAEKYYPGESYINGYSVVYKEFAESYSSDKVVTSLMSIVLVMVILLFTFKSVSIPVLLILAIQGSIWINFSIPMLTGNPVYFIVYLVVSSIMMGSNIDYAIVISSRYLELREHSDDLRRIIGETLSFAFPTVMTSGGIMVVSGYLIYTQVSESIVSGFGHYLATGTLVTMCLVMFVLPQIILVCDALIRKTSFAAAIANSRLSSARVQRVIISLSLAAAGIFALVTGFVSNAQEKREHREFVARYNRQIEAVEALKPSAERFDGLCSQLYDDSTSFAESLLTDQIGSEQLADAEKELEAGRQELEAGQAEFDSYMKQYQAGLSEYNAGLAQYKAGLEEYNAAKEQFNSITPLYNAVIGPYNSYMEVKAQYDAAVAAGDTATATELSGRVNAQRVIFETKLVTTGYSISSLISEYNAAKVELANAEAELAEGKAMLDAGAGELAMAKQMLGDGQTELQDGQDLLTESEKMLDDAKSELEENARQLEEKAEKLEELKNLKAEVSEEISSLDNINEIRNAVSKSATASDICDEAISCYEGKLEAEQEGYRWSRIALCALLIAGILCVCLGVMGVFTGKSITLALIPILPALGAHWIWSNYTGSNSELVLWCCAVVIVCAGVAAFFRKSSSAS